MHTRDRSASTERREGRSQAFNEIELLLRARIRELEEQRHAHAVRSRTFSELVQLMANLERVDELRDVAERIARLRSVRPDPGEPNGGIG